MSLRDTHPYFVENNARGSREETAVLLVGTADEFGIDQRDIKMVRGGFRISQAMLDALNEDYEDGGYDEDEPDGDPEVEDGSEAVEVPDSGDASAEVDPRSVEALAGAQEAAEPVQEAVETKATPKKTSGTRAAKKTQSK